MSLVSGRFLADFLRAIGRVNIDVDSLVGDLPVECSTPYQQHPLIEWEVFVELMTRLERRVGGPDGLEHLGELITDMKPSPVLRRVAGSSASPTAIYNAALKWALPRAFPNLEVEADRSLLISGLVSIAENSIDAMRGGGRLGIEIGPDETGRSVEIRIWDTGPGIPADVRRNIFDTYFTTKAKGTGLGLAIARSVVRGHGGHIEAGEHAEGGGLVTVELPVKAHGRSPRRSDEPEN